MASVVELLKAFNRKERFFLIAAALGHPTFRLAESYREELSQKAGVNIPASDEVFVAMDYHLDWIHAALYLAERDETLHIHPKLDGAVPVLSGNQRDVDLLVAFADGAQTHIAMVEAKLESGWTNKQVAAKSGRLGEIFGPARPQVIPHLVLTSPRPPQQLKTDGWPEWMSDGGKIRWMELPAPEGRIQLVRSDKTGRSSKTGDYFFVRRTASAP